MSKDPEFKSIPFDKLEAEDKINARTTGRDAGVDELADQIAAKGLIEPLIVRPIGMGLYGVIAGGRRYRAIGKLIAESRWEAAKPVPCMVRNEDDVEARETSLMENVGRLPMHPVDQYEKFAELERDDRSQDDIAATFGVPVQQVRQRLALGNLAAEIRAAWRKGGLSADVAQAFAICPDKKLQAKTFKELSKSQSYGIQLASVRNRLVNDRPKLSDPRVRFVGIDRYKAEGGTLVECLFADDGYIENAPLLMSLVADRLREKCDELMAAGWSFAMPESEFPGHVWQAKQETPKPKLTAGQKSRLKEIEKALSEIDGKENAGEIDWDRAGELSAPLQGEKDEIEDAGRAVGFTREQMAATGCVLIVGDEEVKIHYGVYMPSKGKAAATPATSTSVASGAKKADDDAEPNVSGVLTEIITKAQTAAASKVVAEEPSIALALIVAALESASGKCVDVSVGGLAPGRSSLGYHQIDKQLKKVGKLSESDLMDELARLVAISLDCVVSHAGEKPGTDELIAMLPGDKYLEAMREEFDPGEFFARCASKMAINALHEMGETGIRGGRKDDLVDAAAKKAQETGWLPDRLRHPDYALIGQQPRKQKSRKAA